MLGRTGVVLRSGGRSARPLRSARCRDSGAHVAIGDDSALGTEPSDGAAGWSYAHDELVGDGNENEAETRREGAAIDALFDPSICLLRFGEGQVVRPSSAKGPAIRSTPLSCIRLEIETIRGRGNCAPPRSAFSLRRTTNARPVQRLCAVQRPARAALSAVGRQGRPARRRWARTPIFPAPPGARPVCSQSAS